ncbi:hypothetical protein STCU_00573 [Strigomonas culicis]|uniref:DNA recombination and repair protein Rad51-like C-terminal domain-containing protein n=1 Tax=Strigomonas culicis TaxID=28005 RepID=S9V5W0_9TRYP|nr:hypothetical protein STCU_00573 [Strigomonas culicis]|eukprot:EPY36454.1 hypothetical protein STCU_00573 [Strigomonas culicis]
MLDFSDFFKKGSWPSVPLKGNGYFVSGARACGKTSFAFQVAVNCVLDGGIALVICTEASVHAKVPRPFVKLEDLPASALERIQFLYVDSWASAAHELMELSAADEIPSFIMIDDDGFADGADAAAPARAPPSLGSASLALCLSCLENVGDWLARNRRPLSYAVVSNTACADHMRRLPLPLGAFPLVHVWMGASGTVQVTPVAADDRVVEMCALRWRDGLCLA